MHTTTKYLIVPFAVAVLFAEDSAWKTKPVAQWDEHDAKQFLVDSPWIRYTRPAALPEENEAMRRAGGLMGGGQNGVGLEAFKNLNLIGFGARPKPTDKQLHLPAVPIRWESASPVRAAEAKIGAPTWESDDYYAIAVYHMIDLDDKPQKSLATDLKRTAILRRDGKKDLKPARVEILPEGNGLSVVVYLFPRSEPLTVADKTVELEAKIDRVWIEQSFDLAEMQLQGKLEL